VTCNAVCPAGANAAGRKADRDIAAERGISQKQAAEELLAEKQPSLDFASPEQLGGTSPSCARPRRTRSPARQSPSMAVGPHDSQKQMGIG